LFEYSDQKRDPVTVIFYCGLIPFGLFWVIHRSVATGFALQSYFIVAIVFVIYPFEMKARSLKDWSFWRRMLQVGVPVSVLFLLGLWLLDTHYPVFVTGIVAIAFTSFVVGVIEMILVGETVDRLFKMENPNEHLS
jgi:hypothetical protein